MGLVSRLIPAIVLLFLPRALASQTIRTIDDYNGDSVTGVKPIFDGSWNYGPTCPGCKVQPDPQHVFDKSWHDATTWPNDTSSRTVTLTFTGTAIWVFCVVPGYMKHGVTTFANISFALDGEVDGRFTNPGTGSEMMYNVTVYNKTRLANTQHTLVVTPHHEPNASYIAFDYAMYLYEDDETSTELITPTSESPTSSVNPSVIRSHSSGHPTSRVDFTATLSNESSTTVTRTSSGEYYPSSATADPGHVSAVSQTSSPGSKTYTEAILGGVAGGITVAVAVAVLYFCYWYRRRSQSAWHNRMKKFYPPGSAACSPYQDSWRQGPFTNGKPNPLRFPPSFSRTPQVRTSAIVGIAADVDYSRGQPSRHIEPVPSVYHDARTGRTEKVLMQEELSRLEQEMADLLLQQASSPAYESVMTMRAESSLDGAVTQEAVGDGDATLNVTAEGIWENESIRSSGKYNGATSV